jgi:hypothetical protein
MSVSSILEHFILFKITYLLYLWLWTGTKQYGTMNNNLIIWNSSFVLYFLPMNL